MHPLPGGIPVALRDFSGFTANSTHQNNPALLSEEIQNPCIQFADMS